jgi:hypothetical protein
MSVVIKQNVQKYFKSLMRILCEKEYFVFEETAMQYVEDLISDIKANLPIRQHRPAPEYYNKYGKSLYYAVFRKNKNTQWYVFFSKYMEEGEIIYLVCHIGNNHTDAHHL